MYHYKNIEFNSSAVIELLMRLESTELLKIFNIFSKSTNLTDEEIANIIFKNYIIDEYENKNYIAKYREILSDIKS